MLSPRHQRNRRPFGRLAVVGGLGLLTGCSSLMFTPKRPKPEPISELVGVYRREQLRRVSHGAMASPSATQPSDPQPISRPLLATSEVPVTASRPAGQAAQSSGGPPASQPSGGLARALPAPTASQPSSQPAQPDAAVTGVSGKPYRLDADSIIEFAYQNSPLVNASREEMQAAQHALAEFKANLSRFEPFVESRGTLAGYPKRRDSEVVTGQATGGIQKETFEGAVLRLEGGYSSSRVTFGEVDVGAGQKAVEEGDGGLVRARLEVPFVGSRRRQDRVINQAFQESTARRAKLLYITNYRTYVLNALSYYQASVLYRRYVRAYENKLGELRQLIQDGRVRREDRLRIESSITSAQVLRDQYTASFRDSSLSLITTIGIDANDEFEVIDPPYAESRYLAQIQTPDGVARMLAEAMENNPRFRVLQDAIADTELQRQQAIAGEFDITAFVEGTQYPLGSVTYDNRVSGWEVGGGVTVRLNDKRVLTATRLKAEAEIRQFRAQIEAERLRIQREITTETNTLKTYHAVHQQILDLQRQKRTEFLERKRLYLEGAQGQPGNGLMIDDVLYPLDELTSAQIRLASNAYSIGNSESALMGATGDVYRVVGMRIEDERKQNESKGLLDLLSP